ncbi:hypothetical protein [Croceicoccus pelagius]|uniref:DUF2974 domain-containing protein n=1 Tax=Croceicoccus pelagius TaxID=1703341 RepID=A0A916YHJ8_9SPHN|nr:hypothetical protein [Croceicoccus pelagius]GGD44934.1 hypothetical protein GCM10010989_18810 [Croceicoccus pelagius]
MAALPQRLRGRLAFLFLLLCLPALGGCSYTVTRLGQDCSGPGGYCPQTREVAGKTWRYAQLAQNVYWENGLTSTKPDDELYVLPEDLKERFASVDDKVGFAYSVFDRFEGDHLKEVVLVYRGTEGPKDWYYGTLLGQQAPRGLSIYRQVRHGLDEAGYADIPVSLTGHSLGGRIADHVLKKVEREDGALPETLHSYLFNPNAGGWALEKGLDGKTVHTSVSETADVAGWVRFAANDGRWDGYVIDCQSTIDPVASHFMRRLADCLTWIAALDSEAARKSVISNEIDPPVTAGIENKAL